MNKLKYKIITNDDNEICQIINRQTGYILLFPIKFGDGYELHLTDITKPTYDDDNELCSMVVQLYKDKPDPYNVAIYGRTTPLTNGAMISRLELYSRRTSWFASEVSRNHLITCLDELKATNVFYGVVDKVGYTNSLNYRLSELESSLTKLLHHIGKDPKLAKGIIGDKLDNIISDLEPFRKG